MRFIAIDLILPLCGVAFIPAGYIIAKCAGHRFRKERSRLMAEGKEKEAYIAERMRRIVEDNIMHFFMCAGAMIALVGVSVLALMR